MPANWRSVLTTIMPPGWDCVAVSGTHQHHPSVTVVDFICNADNAHHIKKLQHPMGHKKHRPVKTMYTELRWHKLWKLFEVGGKDPFILHPGFYASGNTMTADALAMQRTPPEYSGINTRRVSISTKRSPVPTRHAFEWTLNGTYQRLISWHPMMTSSNGNNFRVTGPLCGEFTVHRWIPLTKASDAELWCILWSAPG